MTRQRKARFNLETASLWACSMKRALILRTYDKMDGAHANRILGQETK